MATIFDLTHLVVGSIATAVSTATEGLELLLELSAELAAMEMLELGYMTIAKEEVGVKIVGGDIKEEMVYIASVFEIKLREISWVKMGHFALKEKKKKLM